MAYLDPNIIMRAPQQPSFGEQMGEAFKMADVVEKQRAMQQQRQDSANLQQYLKEGGNLDTPEGIAKAAEWGRQNLSPSGHQTVVTAGQEMEVKRQKQLESMAKMDEIQLGNMLKKTEIINNSVSPLLAEYNQMAGASGTPGVGKQEAAEQFRTKLQPVLQSLVQNKVITAEQAQQYANATPEQAKRVLEGTVSGRKMLQEAETLRKTRAETEKAELGEEAIRQNLVKRFGESSPQVSRFDKMQAAKLAHEQHLATGGTGGGAGAGGTVAFEEMSPDKQELAKTLATSYLVTQKNAPARGGAYMLQQIGLTRLAKEFNTSVEDMQLAAMDVKTQLQAKPQVEKRIQALDRASNQLSAEMPVMDAAMKRLDLPSLPIAARGNILLLRELGNPDVTKLDQSANVVFNEFETVKTGNPGALYVANMEDAKKQYFQVRTPQQMKAWMENAQDIISRAKKANLQTRREIMEDIKNSLQFNKASGEAPSVAGAATDTKAKSPIKITSNDEYNALPPGTRFIDPKGQARIKPGKQ